MRVLGYFHGTAVSLFMMAWLAGGLDGRAAEAREEPRLGKWVRQFVEKARREEKLTGAISRRYLESEREFASDMALGDTAEKAVAREYGFFRVLSIDRVTVDGSAAVVETTVAYDEAELKERRGTMDLSKMDEKTREAVGRGDLISSELLYSFQTPFEKDGVGRANFYLIKPGQDWLLDYVYFTREALENADLGSVVKELKERAADEKLRSLPDIRSRMLAQTHAAQARYAAKPEEPWSPVLYLIEAPLAPSPAFFSFGPSSEIAGVFYRRRPSEAGPNQWVDIYSPDQWKALTEALAPYRNAESDAGGKGVNELLSICFSREQAPKVLDLLVTKGWAIPVEKFRGYWRRYSIGM